MNINLHIKRLVLDGVNIPPSQRHLLQASVETERTWLLTNGGLTPSIVEGVALSRLSTSGIRLTNNNPSRIAQQTAQSVYEGIGHE